MGGWVGVWVGLLPSRKSRSMFPRRGSWRGPGAGGRVVGFGPLLVGVVVAGRGAKPFLVGVGARRVLEKRKAEEEAEEEAATSRVARRSKSTWPVRPRCLLQPGMVLLFDGGKGGEMGACVCVQQQDCTYVPSGNTLVSPFGFQDSPQGCGRDVYEGDLYAKGVGWDRAAGVWRCPQTTIEIPRTHAWRGRPDELGRLVEATHTPPKTQRNKRSSSPSVHCPRSFLLSRKKESESLYSLATTPPTGPSTKTNTQRRGLIARVLVHQVAQGPAIHKTFRILREELDGLEEERGLESRWVGAWVA